MEIVRDDMMSGVCCKIIKCSWGVGGTECNRIDHALKITGGEWWLNELFSLVF